LRDSHTSACLTACGVALACLFALAPALAPAAAEAGTSTHSRWETHPTPTHEDLVILPGSDILSFDVAGADGRTIYAIGTWNAPAGCIDNDYADDSIAAGQSPVLWKSTDGGATWRDLTGHVLDAEALPDCLGDGIEWNDLVFFTAVAAAPDDADFVIVCGYDAEGSPVVVGSSDGGTKFHHTSCSGLTGEILCADVSPLTPDGRSVAVGTIDLISGGGIWRLDPGRAWSAHWEDTADLPGWADAWLTMSGTGTRQDIYAVTSVAFSPSFAADRAVIAVLVAFAEEGDGDTYTGYYVASGCWDDAPGWNEAAGFDGFPVAVTADEDVIQTDATLPTFFLRHISDVALPRDFEADSADDSRLLFVVNGTRTNPTTGSTTAEGGFLFSLDGAELSSDMLGSAGNPWATSIDYSGDSTLEGQVIAGCFLPESIATDWRWSPDIDDWFSDNGDHDDGDHVLPCGEGVMVLYAEGLDECCPSWTPASTPPSGQFNCQVAFTPDGSRAYATTEGDSRHGLDDYRWGDESAFSLTLAPAPATPWEQTGLIDTMIHEILDLNYAPATGCLYLHTRHLGSSASICECESIWRSCDAGRTFSRVLFGQPDSSEDDEDAFDDVMEKYHRGFTKTTTEGYLYSAGVRFIIGDAIDADEEEQVEAGFEADAVYRVFEAGEWEEISEFTLNYEGLLVMEGAGGRVLYVGFDNLWWDFTDNVPLPYQPDGSDPDLPYGHECRKTSGVARCLLPDGVSCCEELEWDYLIRGLEGAEDTDDPYERFGFSGASLGEGAARLWSIDAENRYWSEDGEDSESYDYCAQEFINSKWGRLWTYDDCPAVASIAATAPGADAMIPTDACECVNDEFVLEWERPCDSCEYEIEVALDPGFANVVLDTEDFAAGTTAGESQRFYLPPHPDRPSLVIAAGQLQPNNRYWWRVRTHLAETDEIIAGWWSEPASFRTAPGPAQPLILSTPVDGATRVPLQNIGFTWSSVSGASSYDFMLVDAERNHVASKIGPETSFVLPGPLQPGTPYVWRVLALDGEQVIAESARVTFLTEPPANVQPAYVQPVITPPQAPGTAEWVAPFVGAVAALLLAALAALSHVNRVQRRRRRGLR
jgi:hypothetical protein